MELTDSHCHIQSVAAQTGEASTCALWAKVPDLHPVDIVNHAREARVTRMICVGCTTADSQLAINFAQQQPNCWASVGIHPHEAQAFVTDKAAQQQFAALLSAPKVVAIGECGLDYFHENADKAAQIAALEIQLTLAREHKLPLIFHVREAFNEFWPVYERYASTEHPIRGVLHSFTDTPINLDRAIGHGLYIGVNGIATFTKNPAQQAVYRKIPLGNLLLETDAPFLTPVPYRGKICEPYHIRTIAEFLAEQREESVEQIATATTYNAQQLFGI